MTHTILLAIVGLFGGAFGSMVGLGGGVFIVPALALFLDVPIHGAISASLLGVVATSTTATVAYVRDNLVNLRLGMTLETLTVAGALAGGFVGAGLSRGVLSAVFGGVMIPVGFYMLVHPGAGHRPSGPTGDVGALGASYHDRSLARTVSYRVRRLPSGLVASLAAGGVSGMLGVGGGFLKVPTMVLAMGVPVRAAAATSSFMIGMTASVGTTVYLARGLIDPAVAVPVVLGVVTGAYLGSMVSRRIRSGVLTVVLALVLMALAVQMILEAAGVGVR